MRRPVSEEGRKVALNMRTTQDVRDRLEASAARSGRSLTHEVEFRVTQALDLDEKLGGAAAAEFHGRLAKMLHLLPLDAFGSEPYLARAALTAGVLELIAMQFPGTSLGLNAEPQEENAARRQMVEDVARRVANAVGASAGLYRAVQDAKEHGEKAFRFGELPLQYAERVVTPESARAAGIREDEWPASKRKSRKKQEPQ